MFRINKPTESVNFWTGEKVNQPPPSASWADFRRAQDTNGYEHLKGIAEAQARRRQADKFERVAKESAKTFEIQDAYLDKIGSTLELNNAARDSAFDYYQQRAKDMANNPNQFQWQMPDFGSRAEAAELTPEQQAQQAAMERGEFVQPEPIQLPEVDTSSWLDNLYSQVSEGLANLSSGVSETFSGLSESASAAFTSLGEIAASALEGVSSAVTAAKDTVQSIWSEVPGFFSGILSGLGGAAEAAGSAIYSGLTSVIGSIIGAWEGAAGTISGIISNISAMGANVGATVSGVIARVRGHAEGGFVTSPELAMIGERGAELILPLTDRERSLDLLSQASSVLGISEELSPSGSSNASSSSGVNVEMNVTFNISGENSQDIVEAIKERIQEIADAAATQLSMTLSDAHHNRVLEA